MFFAPASPVQEEDARRVLFRLAALDVLETDDAQPLPAVAECETLLDHVVLGDRAAPASSASGTGADSTLLLDLGSRHAARHLQSRGRADKLPLAALAAADGGLPADLDCTCTATACDCNKQCFCQIRTSAYSGRRLAPAPGLDALGFLPPQHDCACSLSDVGGPGLDSQNTIDCDCTAASCGCSRRCTCKPKHAPG